MKLFAIVTAGLLAAAGSAYFALSDGCPFASSGCKTGCPLPAAALDTNSGDSDACSAAEPSCCAMSKVVATKAAGCCAATEECCIAGLPCCAAASAAVNATVTAAKAARAECCSVSTLCCEIGAACCLGAVNAQ